MRRRWRICEKNKPSSKTDGRENYANWDTKRELSSGNPAAATPKTVEQLLKLGFSVAVESGAGKLASFDDEAFEQAGAEIVSADNVWHSDVILKVNAPNDAEIAKLNPGTTLVSFIWPAQNPDLMEKLAARGINVMAMDSVRVFPAPSR
ncbi:NAD(P) transhydrogenase alpha subunit [Klebsiella aerogenes]|nr:NAD(P) transhydrogenase alpha subunit [Klebsiella aerogenes]